MKQILLFSFLAVYVFSFGQNRLSLESSADILQKGFKLQSEEKYADALIEYGKININDTNYAGATFESGTCLIELKKYDEARKVLRSLIDDNIKFDYQQDVYSSIGLAYSRQGDSINALKAYNEGVEKYPMDFRLYYNRGITQEALGNYQEAYHDYVRSIQRNIYFAPAHYRLGLLAAHEEHYSEATLSIMTYLLIDPTSNKAGAVIGFLENIADGSFNPEPKNIVFSESNPFEALNLLYKNHVALEKKYKTKFTVSGAYPKQMHLILNNAKFNENDMDFWNQFYLPLYLKINSENRLDQLILLSVANLENDEIQKKVKANLTKITGFLDWVKPVYNENFSLQYFNYEGELKKILMVYENKRLSSFGPLNDQNQADGNFYYYHKNGSLMLKAKYKNGEPIDKFEFYSSYTNNKYKEIEYLGDGKGNKIERYYYPSGELKEKSTFKNDIISDTVYFYYKNGTVKDRIAVENDKRHGTSISYYGNGAVRSKGNYKDGKPDGNFESYHRNGKIESEYSFVNGLREGKIINYYPDGTIQSKYETKGDKYNGPYEEFYPNGKLSEKGTYKNGTNVSETSYYYSNGTLKNTTTLDLNGKENGSSMIYDLDGKKYHEIEYVSGDVKLVKFFDKNGGSKIVYDKKDKKMNYQFYYPNGTLNFEGKFEDGQRQGLWTYYDRYGNVFKVEKYQKGIIEDTVVEFHPNGKIEQKMAFKNGNREGMYSEYSIFGELIEEGFFKNDELDRERYSYYSDGTIQSELFYINGELHGIQKYFAVNGKLKMIKVYDKGTMITNNFYDTLGTEMDKNEEYNGLISLHDPSNSYVNFKSNYLNGESNGEELFLSPENVVLRKGMYSNGYKVGKWQWFYKDGKLSEEANYINGDIHGINTEYYANGKPLYIGNYMYGNAQGEFRRFHENGKVQLEGTHFDDQRHGKVTSYSPDGSILLIREYNRGVITSFTYIGPDGKTVPNINITKDIDSIVTYHQNKNIAMRSKRVNGLIEGLYQTYYENGQIYEKENFLHGEYHGTSINYFPDGKVLSEFNYKYGEKDGIQKTYHANGKLKTEQTYLNGTAHGYLKEYSPEGKLTSTTIYYDGEIVSIKK